MKDSPMVGEMPRDSVIAQMISLSPEPVEVAAVLGLDLPVCGRDVAMVCLVPALQLVFTLVEREGDGLAIVSSYEGT